jgi:hypothetical protein
VEAIRHKGLKALFDAHLRDVCLIPDSDEICDVSDVAEAPGTDMAQAI